MCFNFTQSFRSYLLKSEKERTSSPLSDTQDYPGSQPLTFAHSVRFAIHLSSTFRTAGRLSATFTLVSQSVWPTLTQIHIPLHSPFVPLALDFLSRIYPQYPSQQSDFSSVCLFLHWIHTWTRPTALTLSVPVLGEAVVFSFPPLQSIYPHFPWLPTDSEIMTHLFASPPPDESQFAQRPNPERYCSYTRIYAINNTACSTCEPSLNHIYTQHTEDNCGRYIYAEHAAWRLRAKEAGNELLKLKKKAQSWLKAKCSQRLARCSKSFPKAKVAKG